MFKNDLNTQIRLGATYCEGSSLYTKKVWRYEESAAQSLANIIRQPALQPIPLPDVLQVNDITLCEEQRNAVAMALQFRLSLILGGAGSGKSTLIQAIVKVLNSERNTVLCAPTGKAARNLTNRTGLTWEWETAEESWRPWVLFHAAALLRVALRDKPAAILAAKDGPEISIQKAASDRLWDYTFAAMDDNITNTVHAIVAPCSREQYLWYCPEDIIYP